MKRILLALLGLTAPQLVLAKNTNYAVQENAVWAGSIFLRGSDPTTREKLTDQKLADFAARLERNGVRYVYVFAGPYQKDGRLPDYAFSARAKASIAFLKKAYPSLKILPWIGGVENKTVFLEDDAWQETTLNEIMQESFPSEHLIDGLAIYCDWTTTPADWERVRSWVSP